MTIHATLRMSIFGLGGFGGVISPASSRRNGTAKEIAEWCRGNIPRANILSVGQHNGSVLDVEGGTRFEGPVPSDMVRPVVIFSLSITVDAELTDAIWADLVLALRENGYTVRADEAPSSHCWSVGLVGFQFATEVDAEAIARVNA